MCVSKHTVTQSITNGAKKETRRKATSNGRTTVHTIKCEQFMKQCLKQAE